MAPPRTPPRRQRHPDTMTQSDLPRVMFAMAGSTSCVRSTLVASSMRVVSFANRYICACMHT